MVNYDSDSSGGDERDYTETNVLLGYASKEASEDTISCLGGRPTWLDPAIPPSAALARCKVCRDLMVLLLQLNGDLPDVFPGHERRLYVLSCRRKTCRRKEGSVRVLRGARVAEATVKDQKRENSTKEAKQPSSAQGRAVSSTSIGDSLFGAKPSLGSSIGNPFATSTTPAPTNPFSTAKVVTTNPFANSNLPALSELAAKPPQKSDTPSDLPKTFASALSLNNPPQQYGPVPPPEPWPKIDDLPPPYPLYYIADADYETLDKAENAPMPRQAMEIDEEGGSTSQAEEKDTYESTIDKTFQKFADRLEQNPEQVIRYEFKGQPLLYSKTDAVGKVLANSHLSASKITVSSGSGNSKIPRCSNCGAPRVFEVQLTPHVITELESEDMGLEGMEWGTIIVAVCEKDCTSSLGATGGVSYLEEWAGVQWEEINDRRG